jgi:choline dehydrogenase-like flavoprotein
MSGKHVLLIERAESVRAHPRDERSTLVEKRPYDDRTIKVNGDDRRLYIGGSVGGSTALYGAALLRPSLDDFHPGRHYGNRLPKSRWDWPIDYDALAPHYDQAEQLFGVANPARDVFDPLQPPGSGLTGSRLPLAPINRKLIDSSRAAGWRPFRLPLAINGSTCLRCPACAGYACPNGSRRSGADLLREAAAGEGSVHLLDGTETLKFRRGLDGAVTSVQTRGQKDQIVREFRAKRYVLAAGALGSTAIVLRSGIGGNHTGRGYMYHFSPIVIGLFRSPTEADRTFVKQVGYADHYFGAPGCREKIGIIQSLPAPGPLMMRKHGSRGLPTPVLKMLRRRMLPLLGIVEDLPDPSNRIRVDGGRISLTHRFSEFDRWRGRALAKQMVRVLKRAGAVHCLVRHSTSSDHVAHQCGTLPMSARKEHGVVSPECRVFDAPNLFVVDGSVLPSSLGVGPALTIMANSLRVADHVISEC